MTDAELIAASLERPEAFEGVFDRHFPAIHRYVAGRAGRDVADAVASETFCVAFSRRETYDLERADARPWLYGIAINLMRRHWRTQGRRSVALGRLAGRAGAAPLGDGAAGPALARVVEPPLRDAVESLSAGDRDVLLLFAWAELSYEEIAVALEIPVGTVRSRLHRARRAVRSHLEAEASAPGTTRTETGADTDG